MPSKALALRLELTVDEDAPPHGCVLDPAGRALAFWGWLELMSVLDGVLIDSGGGAGLEGSRCGGA